jgi:retinol dehydrogenase 14
MTGTQLMAGKNVLVTGSTAGIGKATRRVEGTGVTSTVLHPGVVRTNFGADDPAGLIKAMLPLVRPFMKTPTAGAATAIYLASSVKVEGVTGRYFAGRKPKTSTKVSYDTAVAARLWKVGAELAGLTTVPTTRGAS